MHYHLLPLCGCYYLVQNYSRSYLPLVDSTFHSTVLEYTQHTKLTQTFKNTSKESIESCKYVFPLYDGVSVVSFSCKIGGRTLHGTVKEKDEARKDFDAAVASGQKAGLLDQSNDASDVFSTSLGNVPAGDNVVVEIEIVGELQHDAEHDGIRLMIPAKVAPRYGSSGMGAPNADGKMSVTVDIQMSAGSPIQKILSPSHPTEVSMGVLSANLDADPEFTKATASLSQNDATLEKDFVLVVKAKNIDQPRAVLEQHATIPNHRAILATLIPKFALQPIRPEIVFVCDRSGSMSGKIPLVQQAMTVFLKSLPSGVMFNICSFGSRNSLLFPKSTSHSKTSIEKAIAHVGTFDAHYGGTETLAAIKSVVKVRRKDLPLEIVLLTDGDIWAQEECFEYVNQQAEKQVRVFPLGIGTGVSSSLIDGLARAGNGFPQHVQDGERMETKVVRMLKGALTPHVTDYSLEVVYGEKKDDDDYEFVDKFGELSVSPPPYSAEKRKSVSKKVISLFDTSKNLDTPPADDDPQPYLPKMETPACLQVPEKIPALFPFSRTTAYLLLSPDSHQHEPAAVILRGTCGGDELRLEIPVSRLSEPGTTVHALAARKAAQDLEEGRGWVRTVKDKASGKRVADQYPSRVDELVKREAVRLGTTFGVANRWCSFVALEGDAPVAEKETMPAALDLDLAMDEAPVVELARGAAAPAAARKSAGPRFRLGASVSRSLRMAAPAAPKMQMQQQQMQQQMTQAAAQQNMSHAVGNAQVLSSIERGYDMGGGGRDKEVSEKRESVAEDGWADFGSSKKKKKRSSGRGGAGFDPARVVAPGRVTSRGEGQAATGADRSRNMLPTVTKSISATSRSPAAAPMSFSAYGAPPPPPAPSGADMPRERRSAAKNYYFDQDDGEDEEMEDAAAPATEQLDREEAVGRVIGLQEFEGFWKGTTALAALLGFGGKDLAGKGDELVTAMVVRRLEESFAAEKEVWEFVVDKARDWLRSRGWDEKREREELAKVDAGK